VNHLFRLQNTLGLTLCG